MLIAGFNFVLFAGCIVLTVMIANMHTYSKGLVIASRIVGIYSIVHSLFQQLVTFFVGGLLLSLSDGNGLNSYGEKLYFVLLLLPFAIIVAAIVLLVITHKKSKLR